MRVALGATRARSKTLNSAIGDPGLDGIVARSPDGDVIFINERAMSIMGVTRGEALAAGRNRLAYLSVRDDGSVIDPYDAVFLRVLRTRQPRREQHGLIRSSGAVALIDIDAAPVDGAGCVARIIALPSPGSAHAATHLSLSLSLANSMPKYR